MFTEAGETSDVFLPLPLFALNSCTCEMCCSAARPRVITPLFCAPVTCMVCSCSKASLTGLSENRTVLSVIIL